MVSLESIPAIIIERDDLDSVFATAIENMQREHLDIEDEARAFAYLIELSGLSQRKLAKRLGLNHVYQSRRIKLLKRPDLMQAYREGQLTLFDVLARLDQPTDAHGADGEALSVQLTSAVEDSHRTGLAGEERASVEAESFELIERDDLGGFCISPQNGAFGFAYSSSSTAMIG